MTSRGGVSVACLPILLAACTANRGALDKTEREPQHSRASRECSRHYTNVRYAELTTASALRNVGGPRLKTPPPSIFDNYKDTARVVLCLVPSGSRFDVMGVVLSDGQQYQLWSQASGRALTPPP